MASPADVMEGARGSREGHVTFVTEGMTSLTVLWNAPFTHVTAFRFSYRRLAINPWDSFSSKESETLQTNELKKMLTLMPREVRS